MALRCVPKPSTQVTYYSGAAVFLVAVTFFFGAAAFLAAAFTLLLYDVILPYGRRLPNLSEVR
jgi:hypothetical protein